MTHLPRKAHRLKYKQKHLFHLFLFFHSLQAQLPQRLREEAQYLVRVGLHVDAGQHAHQERVIVVADDALLQDQLPHALPEIGLAGVPW